MSHHSDVYWTCLAYFQGILPDPVAPTSPADVGGQSGAPGDPPAGVRSPPSPPRVYGDPMTPPRPPQSFINPRRRPPRATADGPSLRPGLSTLPEASAVPQSVIAPPSPSKPWVRGDPQTPPVPPQSFINPRRRVPPAAAAASERDGPLTRVESPAVPRPGGPDDGGEHTQTGLRTGDEADSTGKRARTPPLHGITTSESTVTSMPPASSRRVRFTLPDRAPSVDDPPPPTAPRRETLEPTDTAVEPTVATAKSHKSMPPQEFEAFYFSELPPLQTPAILTALTTHKPGSDDTVARVATTTPQTVPAHDPCTVTATAATATATTADLSPGMLSAGPVRSLFPPVDVADDSVDPASKVDAAANVDALPTSLPASTTLLPDIATAMSSEPTAVEAVVEVDTPKAPHPLAQRPPKIILTTVPPPSVLVSPLPALPIGESGPLASILADALSQQLPWRPEIPPALIVGEYARLRLPSHDVVDAALAMGKFRCLGQLVYIDRNTRIFDPPAV